MGDLPFPTCSDTVKDGNYAATLSFESSLVYGPCAEDLMARWLIVNGPLSVALDAMGMDYYSDGIDMGEVRLTDSPTYFWGAGGRVGSGRVRPVGAALVFFT